MNGRLLETNALKKLVAQLKKGNILLVDIIA